MGTAATTTATAAMETVAMMTKERQPLRLRHERKHQINLREDIVLTGRLEKLFSRDRYAGKDGTYRVTSLYFDTPYDKALREKLDGTDNREKFRLRYYGTDTSFIRLEKKIKRNGLCGKRTAPLTAGQTACLLKGEYGFLLDTGIPLLEEFYSKLQGQGLRPKTLVCYDREAFVYGPGNVRITLDRNIWTGLGSVEFFDTRHFYLPVLPDTTVLEVKYDEFLPDIVRMAVQVPGRQAAACSKYALCRRFD